MKNKVQNTSFVGYLMIVVMFLISVSSHAQDCTVNAGTNLYICPGAFPHTLNLSGNTNGNIAAVPSLWSLVSGPSATIVDAASLVTDASLTGLGTYQFELSQACDNGTARDTITVTVSAPPLVDAGTHDTICSSPYSFNFGASPIPAGYTGTWYQLNSGTIGAVSDINSPTSLWTAPSSSCGFQTQMDHNQRFVWSVSQGQCVVNDTVEYLVLRDLANARVSTRPPDICGTRNTARINCVNSAYDTITFTVLSGPNTPTLSYIRPTESLMEVIFSNLVVGTYSIDFTVSNSINPCSNTFSDNFTFTVNGLSAPSFSMDWDLGSQFVSLCVDSAIASSPIGLEVIGLGPNDSVSWTRGGGGSFGVNNLYLINDSTARQVTATLNPAFLASIRRTRGSIFFYATVYDSSRMCNAREFRSLNIYPDPIPVWANDGVACPGANQFVMDHTQLGPIVEPGSDEWLYFLNSSMSFISGPRTPSMTRTSTRDSDSTNDFYTISNLDTAGVYTFSYNMNGFNFQNCYNGPRRDTFTITVPPSTLSFNAGTDQSIICGTTALAGNAPAHNIATWNIISQPAHVFQPGFEPAVSDIHDASATAFNLDSIGTYVMTWGIPGCPNEDTVNIDITQNCAPLPVDLLLFSGSLYGDEVILNWSTATEVNNDHFVVEKSKDGQHWERLANRVEGRGNSNTIQQYSDVDPAPYSGISFYRLKQVDYNGGYTYSDIISINDQAEGETMVIHPNPFHLSFQISHIQMGDEVIVFNSVGKEVKSDISTATEMEVNMRDLARGVYFIQVNSAANAWQGKVTKVISE